jgi:hypothetical protein
MTAQVTDLSPIGSADEEKPVAYMIVGKGGRWLQWAPRVADDDADLVTVVPLFASLRAQELIDALTPFANAWDVATRSTATMTMGELGAIAAYHVTGVHFRRASNLLAKIAELDEPRGLSAAEPSSNGEGVKP